MLFLYLGKDYRKVIINDICKEIKNLIINRYGQCSVLFILENKLTDNEKNLVLECLKPMMIDLLNIPPFLRVAECIISLYPFSKIKYVLEYSIENLDYFIEIKEGYFFVRMITKSCKDSQIQRLLLEKITCNLVKFVSIPNGVLICQSFIYNIPLKNFSFIKSCSKHLENEDFPGNENQEDYDMQNCNLIALIFALFENIKYWDNYNLRKVVICAINVSSKAFVKVLLRKYSLEERKKLLKCLILLENSEEILTEIEKSTKLKYLSLIIIECYDVIKRIKEYINDSTRKYINNMYKSIKSKDSVIPNTTYQLKSFQQNYTPGMISPSTYYQFPVASMLPQSYFQPNMYYLNNLYNSQLQNNIYNPNSLQNKDNKKN